MNEYGWAQNRAKLERAIDECKATGQEVNDENVKKIYRRILGFVIGEDIARVSKELDSMTSEQLIDLANKKAKKEVKKEVKPAVATKPATGTMKSTKKE